MRDDYVRDYVLISQSVLVVFVPTIWDGVFANINVFMQSQVTQANVTPWWLRNPTKQSICKLCIDFESRPNEPPPSLKHARLHNAHLARNDARPARARHVTHRPSGTGEVGRVVITQLQFKSEPIRQTHFEPFWQQLSSVSCGAWLKA